jgi:hypothetical protein
MWTDVFYKNEVPLGSDHQHVWRSFWLAILTEWKTFADNDSEGETTASREARLALCTLRSLRPHWAVQWEHQVVGHIDWLSGLPMVFFLVGKTRANAQSQRKLLVSYILWYLCLESSKDVASSFTICFFTTGNILVSGLQSAACDCRVRLPYWCLREKEQDVVDLLG